MLTKKPIIKNKLKFFLTIVAFSLTIPGLAIAYVASFPAALLAIGAASVALLVSLTSESFVIAEAIKDRKEYNMQIGEAEKKAIEFDKQHNKNIDFVDKELDEFLKDEKFIKRLESATKYSYKKNSINKIDDENNL